MVPAFSPPKIIRITPNTHSTFWARELSPQCVPPPPRNTQDLKKKPKLREKYSVADEWVMPFEVVPIIDIPGYGDKAAQLVCEQLKIQSQNDTAKLTEAKGMVYLKVRMNEGSLRGVKRVVEQQRVVEWMVCEQLKVQS